MNGVDPSGHAKTSNGATKGGNGNKTGESGRLSQNNKTPASTSTRQSPVKPPYTDPPTPPKPAPNYQKPTYSSGAARAAQGVKTANVQSHPASSVVGGIVTTSHQPMRKSHESLPVVIENFTESAKKFIRNTCSANMQHVQAQNELNRLQTQLILDMAGKVPGIAQSVWKNAAETNYRAFQTQQAQTQQDILVQLMLLEDAWNSAAQAYYLNLMQQEKIKLDSLKSAVAVFRPLTNSMKEWSESQEGTLQLGANFGASGGLSGSIEGGLAMDLQGNIGVYSTFSVGNDFSGLLQNQFPAAAKFQWEPVYDRVSLSATGVTVMNAPSIDALSGGGTSFGLSATDAYGATGGVAFVTSGNANAPNYYGVSFFAGVSTSPGADFNETFTYTVISYRNIYEDLLKYYDFIEELNIP